MSILIIGKNGSMGTRYQAILSKLAIPFYGVDKESSLDDTIDCCKASYTDGIILATPTHTHKAFLVKLAKLKKPVLCEKPIVKNASDVKEIIELFKKHETPFTMTMQYSELVDDNSKGDSHFDYFKTGPDGLYWDTLQIVGLAKGKVTVNNKSPIWNCMINGKQLSIVDMDHAYVSFVSKWISGAIEQDGNDLIEMHRKVEREYELSRSESSDRNPSPIYQ
jgi:hypothetical protein